MGMTVYYRIDNKKLVDGEKIQKENRTICNFPILFIKLESLHQKKNFVPIFHFKGSDILTDGQ